MSSCIISLLEGIFIKVGHNLITKIDLLKRQDVVAKYL